jgi:hypothetical protein
LCGERILEVTVLLEGETTSPSDSQLRTINFLRSIPLAISEDISVAARDYFRRLYRDGTSADEGLVIDENNIDAHFTFNYISVPKLGKCELPVAVLSADCDWEREHGMHLLLLNTSILYCGSCSTLFYGKGWKSFIYSDGEESQLSPLREHLASVT